MNTSPMQKIPLAEDLTVAVAEAGPEKGRPLLVLHGAQGPSSVAGFVGAMAENAHVYAPTHPGFEGEPRPERFDTVDDLASAYVDLLDRLDLHDVIVVGFSFGGWIAAELAVRNATRLSGLVLVDAAGIEVEGYDMNSVLSRPPAGGPPAGAPPMSHQQAAARAGNREAMMVYTKDMGLSNPTLRRRLVHVTIPALVVWGENDPILPPDYGRAYAQAPPNARFVLIEAAGHFPQLEQPERLLHVVREFTESIPFSQATK